MGKIKTVDGIQKQPPSAPAALSRATFTFSGSYTRVVDAKGRFNLPFKLLRAGTGSDEEKFVVSSGADGSLCLFPHSVWEANFNRLRENYTGRDLRRYLRRLSSNSKVVEPDSQGRVAVTREILSAFGIDRKIALVGMGNHLELWDPAALAATNSDDASDDVYDDEFFR